MHVSVLLYTLYGSSAVSSSALKHHVPLHLAPHCGQHKHILFQKGKATSRPKSMIAAANSPVITVTGCIKIFMSCCIQSRQAVGKRSNDKDWKIITNHTCKVAVEEECLEDLQREPQSGEPRVWFVSRLVEAGGGGVAGIKFSNWWLLINSPASILGGTKDRLSSVSQTCGTQEQRSYRTFGCN